MNTAFFIGVGFLSGIASGFLYFGILWLSVRYSLADKGRKVFLFLGFILRIGILVAVLYANYRFGSITALFASLAGFMVSRMIAVRSGGGKQALQRGKSS